MSDDTEAPARGRVSPDGLDPVISRDDGVALPASGVRYAFSSLRHRDFGLFWSAALISNSGSWMQTITVPYVIYRLTHHSSTWLGLAAFMTFFPALIVGPMAGILADRFERRRILLLTQTVQMIVAFALWGLWVSGRATPGLILANLLVAGVAQGINIAAWQSFVPLLVPPKDMLNAVRLNSMQFTGARAFGPAIGGLVLARFGPSTAFMVNAITFLLVIGVLGLISPRPHVPARGVSWITQFKEGLLYTRRRRALMLPVLAMTAISFFGSSLVQLAPAFASSQFNVGASAYGLLVTAFGAGAIIGSVVMSLHGERFRRSRTALVGWIMFVVGTLVLAQATRYAIGLFALGSMGLAYLLMAVSLNTSIQARVAEQYRGRVLSIYLMGLLGGVPFGALVEGRLADVIGLRPTVLGAGLGLLVCLLVAVVRFDGLAPLDESLDADAERDPSLRFAVASDGDSRPDGLVAPGPMAPVDPAP